MDDVTQRYIERALDLLREHGLLLLADPRLPSLTTLIAGEPVRGSWWGHPRGNVIYAVALALEASPDVASVKLVSGKATFVHHLLWPALLAIGTARDPWQLDSLSPLARLLLAAVDRDGLFQSDDAAELEQFGRKAIAAAARELELALLVYAESVHTESGAHAKRLASWQRWAGRRNLTAGAVTAAAGREQFERTLARLSERFHARGRLPWPSGYLLR
jgi:hypothetical protein